MIKLINRLTGTEMWVTDDRLDEYLAAGHKPAASDESPEVPIEPTSKAEEPEVVVKPARRRRRKESG